ncbi:MAG: mandelate racemase, partial [Candidatus Eremiobacteraeota bacterium]|nr:mandelate racemase [Candidatus Eremiobacteraeota bacterium]
PLHAFIKRRIGNELADDSSVRVYSGGGYRYPADDGRRLADEMRRVLDRGFTHAKMKIGGAPIADDLHRIEAAATVLGSADRLAVDAMNAYEREQSFEAADALAPYGLSWFEDVCDPLDFDTHAAVARRYSHPIAAGEALFSVAEAQLLDRFGGLRRDRDILLFDPTHCYGLPGYLRIVRLLERAGWPRSAFWPHGGHLYTLHVAGALQLGGSELNPFSFQPFGGLADGMVVENGRTQLPQSPGIGFERKRELAELFVRLAL